MVSFRNFFTAAVALSVPVAAQLSPAQVVSNIRTLTQKSQALQAPAQTTTAIAQMQGMPPVPAGADSDAIFDAFREFVRVHQALLNILIGKAGLFQTVPFIGQPLAAVLRQIENVVDTIAFGLIDAVESRASDLQREANSLDGTLTICINSYEGLSGNLKAKRSLRFARREIAAAA
ncbi:unnamed protein product [Alternaria alternata]